MRSPRCAGEHLEIAKDSPFTARPASASAMARRGDTATRRHLRIKAYQADHTEKVRRRTSTDLAEIFDE
jgi:hypothetical protein